MSTAPEIKRLLAAAWPGVVFDYGTAGRGRAKGLSVGWTGGPSLEGVASTPGCQRTGTMSHTRVAVHFVRRPSPEEHAAEMAAWEAGRPAREAAAQEAIAARRAAGAARRAASRAARIAAEACFWRPDLHPPGQAWLLNPEAWPVFRRALVGVHAP